MWVLFYHILSGFSNKMICFLKFGILISNTLTAANVLIAKNWKSTSIPSKDEWLYKSHMVKCLNKIAVLMKLWQIQQLLKGLNLNGIYSDCIGIQKKHKNRWLNKFWVSYGI